MNKRDTAIASVVVALIAVAVVVWVIPDYAPSITGGVSSAWTSPWHSVNASAVASSTTAWLSTPSAQKMFPGGTMGEPVPVFNENGLMFQWLVPVKGPDGMYVGYIQTTAEDFRNPSITVKYSTTKDSFIGKDDAVEVHTFFIMTYGSKYDPNSIGEPYVVMKSAGGYAWMSEITNNGAVADRIFSEDIKL